MQQVGKFWFCPEDGTTISITAKASFSLVTKTSPFIQNLPTQIALPVTEYLAETQPFIKLHRLVDAAELITRVFAIIALSDSRRQVGEFSVEVKRQLAQQFAHPSFGVWVNIIETALQLLKDRHKTCFVSELPTFLQGTWKPLIGSGNGDPEREILALRNRLAHGGRLPDEASVSLLNKHRVPFEEALQGLSFLAHYSMISTLSEAQSGLPLQLRGLPTPDDWILPRLETIPEGLTLLPQRVYLLRKEEALDLFPLQSYDTVMLWSEEDRDFRKVDKPAPMLYLRYNDKRQVLELTTLAPKVPFSQRGKDFVNAFLEAFNLIEWRKLLKKEHGYDFRDVIDDLSEGLVGRSEHLEDVKKWIRSRQQAGGVLWVGGKPGVGKSAFMAELAKRLKNGKNLCVIPFFFRNGDHRCNSDYFYKAAMLTFSEVFGISIKENSRQPQRALFSSAIGEVRRIQNEQKEPITVLFLLDGLDEVVGQSQDMLRLPLEHQMPLVVWVCAGRKEITLQELFDAPEVETLWEEGELPPLTELDIRMLIEQECEGMRYELFEQDQQTKGEYRNHFLEELVKKSEGLPLYVRMVIEDLKERRLNFRDTEKLPQGLQNYFETLLERLKVGDLPRALTEVLALLCRIYEPMEEEIIADILQGLHRSEWKSEVQKAMRYGHVMLKRVITPEERWGWTFYHESFRQHLRETKTIEKTRQEALNDGLLAWCKRWQDHRHPYAFRHYARHLLEEKLYDELFVLVDGPWLSTKVELMGPTAAAKDLGLAALACAEKAAVSAEDSDRLIRYLLRQDNFGLRDINLSRSRIFGFVTHFEGLEKTLHRVDSIGDPRRRAISYADMLGYLHGRDRQGQHIVLEKLKGLIEKGIIVNYNRVIELIAPIYPDLANAMIQKISEPKFKISVILNLGQNILQEPAFSGLYEIGLNMLRYIDDPCKRLSFEVRLVRIFSQERLFEKLEEVRNHLQSHLLSHEKNSRDILCDHAHMISSLWNILNETQRKTMIETIWTFAENLPGAFQSHDAFRDITMIIAENDPEWAERILYTSDPSWGWSFLASRLAEIAFERGDIPALKRLLPMASYAPAEIIIRGLLIKNAIDTGNEEEARRQYNRAKALAEIVNFQGGIPSVLAKAAVSLGADQATAILTLVERAKELAEALPTPGDKSRAFRDISIALTQIDLPAALSMIQHISISNEKDEGLLYIVSLIAKEHPGKARELCMEIKDPSIRSQALGSILCALVLQDLSMLDMLAVEIKDPLERARALRDVAIALSRAGRQDAWDVALKIEVDVEASLTFWSIALAEGMDERISSMAKERADDLSRRLTEEDYSKSIIVRAIQTLHKDVSNARNIIRTLPKHNWVPSALTILAANCDQEGLSNIVPSNRWNRSGFTGTMGRPFLLHLGEVSSQACQQAQDILREAIELSYKKQQYEDAVRANWIAFKVYLAEGSPQSLAEAVKIAIATNDTVSFLLSDLVRWHVKRHSTPEAIHALIEAIMTGYS